MPADRLLTTARRTPGSRSRPSSSSRRRPGRRPFITTTPSTVTRASPSRPTARSWRSRPNLPTPSSASASASPVGTSGRGAPASSIATSRRTTGCQPRSTPAGRGFRDDVLGHRYRYALIDGTVYEVGAAPNATVSGHGGHRLDLTLRTVQADRTLGVVSVDVEDVPRPLRRAAETGSATGYVEEVPASTIELEDGRFQRVYIANRTYPTENERDTAALLRLGLPAVGLGLLGWSWRRFAVDVSVAIRHRG